jgi:hypothetical protein
VAAREVSLSNSSGVKVMISRGSKLFDGFISASLVSCAL